MGSHYSQPLLDWSGNDPFKKILEWKPKYSALSDLPKNGVYNHIESQVKLSDRAWLAEHIKQDSESIITARVGRHYKPSSSFRALFQIFRYPKEMAVTNRVNIPILWSNCGLGRNHTNSLVARYLIELTVCSMYALQPSRKTRKATLVCRSTFMHDKCASNLKVPLRSE